MDKARDTEGSLLPLQDGATAGLFDDLALPGPTTATLTPPDAIVVAPLGASMAAFIHQMLPPQADRIQAQIISISISPQAASVLLSRRISEAALSAHHIVIVPQSGHACLAERIVLAEGTAELPGRGVMISISGPDGVGKSTVIAIVKAQLQGALGPALRLREYHIRPRLLPPIGALLRKPGHTDAATTGSEMRPRPSRRLGSWVRLAYYWFDYALGHWRLIRPDLQAGTTVLFDRHFADIVADPAKARLGLPSTLLGLVSRTLPRPDLAFVLRAPAEHILSRKQEMSRDEIDRVNAAYDRLIAKGALIGIENAGSAERAAAEIVDHILMWRDTACRRALAQHNS